MTNQSKQIFTVTRDELNHMVELAVAARLRTFSMREGVPGEKMPERQMIVSRLEGHAQGSEENECLKMHCHQIREEVGSGNRKRVGEMGETQSREKKARREPEVRGLEPNEELMEVAIRKDGEVVKIGAQLSEEIRDELISLVMRYAYVFAFSTDDLVGLDPKVAEHHLNVDTGVRPVKQKRRHFGAEIDWAIEEEMERLLRADTSRKPSSRDGYPMQLW